VAALVIVAARVGAAQMFWPANLFGVADRGLARPR
jgi:hypothetical protein